MRFMSAPAYSERRAQALGKASDILNGIIKGNA